MFAGRGGDTIRYLSRVSKARISVDRDEQRRYDGTKKVTITGSQQAIENAKVTAQISIYMILESSTVTRLSPE